MTSKLFWQKPQIILSGQLQPHKKALTAQEPAVVAEAHAVVNVQSKVLQVATAAVKLLVRQAGRATFSLQPPAATMYAAVQGHRPLLHRPLQPPYHLRWRVQAAKKP